MIDYAGVIADLEGKRGAIDEILSGFKRLAGTAPGRPAAVAPARLLPTPPQRVAKKPARRATKKAVKKPAVTPAAVKPAPTPIPKSPGRSASPELLARAKAIVARDGFRAAVKATGIPYPTLYGRAKREQWPPASKRAPPPTTKPTAASAPVPRDPVGTPLRVCTQCARRVTVDPCPHCGVAWHRTNG